MFGALAKSIFGSSNERYVKSLGKVIDQIAAFEPTIQAMSDDELVNQTARFRERLANGETLDSLLPEAFATVREASVRVLGMRHFDVQMIGGIVLHRGEIAEMRTGAAAARCVRARRSRHSGRGGDAQRAGWRAWAGWHGPTGGTGCAARYCRDG